MYRLLIVIPLMLPAMLACPEHQSRSPQNPDPAHTSKNSLSWEGIYSGISTCADCPGILTEIELKQNSTYMIARHYLGEDDSVFRESGTFAWNDAGNHIMLSGNDEQSFRQRFLVGENRLIQFNNEGERIQTSFPEMYVFEKISVRYHPNPDY